jgi:septal ring factor EnvC (AmiA/AmiB activator)
MTNDPSDKLERLLQDWGDARTGRVTDECLTISQAAAFASSGHADPAQSAHVLSCPTCARLVGRLEAAEAQPSAVPIGPHLLWPRMALAAAAVLAAAGLYMVLQAASGRAELRTAKEEIAHLQTRFTRLEQEADQLDEQRRQAAQRAAELDVQLEGRSRELQQAKASGDAALARLKEAEQTLAEAKGAGEQVARLEEQLAAVRKDLRQAQDSAAALAESAKKAEGLLERTRTDMSARVADLQGRADRLTEEVGRLQARQAEQLAVVRGTWRMLLGQRRTGPVGPAALAAMRSTARSADLAGRAAVLAAAAEEADLVRLLNQLEVVLVRLALADPADTLEQEWMGHVVAGPLLERIESALADRTAAGRKTSPELVTFLTQTEMLFLRGACAS